MRHTTWGGLAGLAAWLVGVGVPADLRAQPPAAALRVVSTAPNGPVQSPVTQATIRFAEPMVAVGGADVDRVPYVHVSPEIPVGFRWADTNVL